MSPEPYTTRSPAVEESVKGKLKHVGVILDGNRRWARRNSRPMAQAYHVGAERVVELAHGCADAGIDYVTVWALSQENLQRAPTEINSVLDAICLGLHEIASSGHWRIRPVGELELLPERCATALNAIRAGTADAGPGTLNVAVAYSGRRDILTAVSALMRSADANKSGPDIDTLSALFSRHVANAGQPDIDLVIRTSGETRLSGFMPWQTAYSELHFTAVDWPDFDAAELDAALQAFAHRNRRLGL
ncbi:polyprenyl diphosphate synthase [Streptomyces sp. NPDC005122]